MDRRPKQVAGATPTVAEQTASHLKTLREYGGDCLMVMTTDTRNKGTK